MNRLIKVSGKGRLSLKPDRTVLNISMTRTYREYEKTVSKSIEHLDLLRSAVERAGLAGEDLKTTEFYIDTEYEWYKSDGEEKRRLSGYSYRHDLFIEFDRDSGLTGRVLKEISGLGLNATVNISYTVKNRENAREELLGICIRDAKRKASVIAAASGVELLGIVNIDYSVAEIDFYSKPMDNMMLSSSNENVFADSLEGYLPLNIEPEDISTRDSVTIWWEIKDLN